METDSARIVPWRYVAVSAGYTPASRFPFPRLPWPGLQKAAQSQACVLTYSVLNRLRQSRQKRDLFLTGFSLSQRAFQGTLANSNCISSAWMGQQTHSNRKMPGLQWPRLAETSYSHLCSFTVIYSQGHTSVQLTCEEKWGIVGMEEANSTTLCIKMRNVNSHTSPLPPPSNCSKKIQAPLVKITGFSSLISSHPHIFRIPGCSFIVQKQ